mgnify:CR=1 FL=1
MKKQLANSKLRLLEALAEIIKTQGIEEIKISEVISRAHVSHSTFYRFFQSKDNFFSWTLTHYLDGLFAFAKHVGQEPEDFYLSYFQYIYNNKVYFQAFNNSSMWPEFSYKMHEMGIKAYEEFIYLKTGEREVSVIISNYIINAHIGATMAWLRQSIMIKPSEMASLVYEMTNTALASQNLNLEELFPINN